MSTATCTIEPRWVLFDGELCHVSDFAHLPPKLRPQTTCPLCDGVVTLKLGKVRVHHYAHSHDRDCPATHPETALHSNTKFHFYRELKAALQAPSRELSLQQECLGKGCNVTRKQIWTQAWDEVQVEFRMDSIRPDIALLRQGQVIAALEILVTHAVDEGKAERLQNLDISWVEIQADESLYLGETAWKVVDPLPSVRHHPQNPDWICSKCQEKELERRRREEAAAKQREYERLNYTETYMDRMVDFYFPTSEKHREIFEVQRIIQNGYQVRSWLHSERRGLLHSVDGVLTQELLDQFTAIVESEIDDLIVTGTIIDEIMPWRRAGRGTTITPRNHRIFRFRYYWSEGENIWIRGEKPVPQPVLSRSVSHSDSVRFKSYPCIWCGQITNDWYHYDGQGSCRCNDCDRKQRGK